MNNHERHLGPPLLDPSQFIDRRSADWYQVQLHGGVVAVCPTGPEELQATIQSGLNAPFGKNQGRFGDVFGLRLDPLGITEHAVTQLGPQDANILRGQTTPRERVVYVGVQAQIPREMHSTKPL
jgi:hypothetical protein